MIRSFRHHAQQRFGAGRADQNAAVFAKFVFRLADRRHDERIIFPRFFIIHAHIAQNLRIRGHQLRQFRKFAAALLHDRQRLHRRQYAVTGRIVVEENDMARLFAAEHIIMGAHFFQHVPVSDRCENGL